MVHENWPKNGPRQWLKYKPKINPTLLCTIFIKLNKKKWRSRQQLILPEMRVF